MHLFSSAILNLSLTADCLSTPSLETVCHFLIQQWLKRSAPQSEKQDYPVCDKKIILRQRRFLYSM